MDHTLPRGDAHKRTAAGLPLSAPWYIPNNPPPHLPGAEMNVLLVDDDAELSAVLTLALGRAGYTVSATDDPHEALSLLHGNHPALVILGASLGAASPVNVLEELRRADTTTVIMLIGRGSEDERVAGLDAGADDYVSKPFSTRELVARVHAILRHRPNSPALPAVITVGRLTLDTVSHSVSDDGRPLTLTVTEFRLLHYLMTHTDTAIPFSTLLQYVWGFEHTGATDVVRTTVYRLRRKLGDDPAQPQRLRSVPGVGFLLAGPTSNSRS